MKKEYSITAQEDFEFIRKLQSLEYNGREYNVVFTKFYHKQYHLLVNYWVIKYNNADLTRGIVNESLAKFSENIQEFDFNFTFSTYISVIIQNKFNDYFRRVRVHRKNIDKYLYQEETSPPIADEPIIIKEDNNRFNELIALITNDKHREAFRMQMESDYSLEKIGEIMGISFGLAKMYCYRGKKELQEKLKKIKIQNLYL